MAEPAPKLTPQQWYVLVVLLGAYVCNFLDRQVVNILAEPIRRDLHISDTQIGLLTGFAFALLYTLLGIPLAQLADNPKTNRARLISAALFVWSGATALCGASQTFAQLLLARVGVGVGEAGCTPAALSLIAETVPERRRASSIAFYGLGYPIGVLLGLVLGGTLADAFGWRRAFMVVGIPGLLLSLLVLTTLKDPRFTNRRALSQPGEARVRLRPTLQEIAGSRTFVLLTVGASVSAFIGYGGGVWQTIWFIRDLGLSPGKIGLAGGLLGGVTGIAGVWLGGALAERLGSRNPGRMLAAPALGLLLGVPFHIAAYLQHNWVAALLLLSLSGVLSGMYFGPVFTCIQGLVRPQSRAIAVAIVAFSQNFFGLGFGPLAFGALSDALKPHFGTEGVRIVLLYSSPLSLVPALAYWLASRRIGSELAVPTPTAAQETLVPDAAL